MIAHLLLIVLIVNHVNSNPVSSSCSSFRDANACYKYYTCVKNENSNIWELQENVCPDSLYFEPTKNECTSAEKLVTKCKKYDEPIFKTAKGVPQLRSENEYANEMYDHRTARNLASSGDKNFDGSQHSKQDFNHELGDRNRENSDYSNDSLQSHDAVPLFKSAKGMSLLRSPETEPNETRSTRNFPSLKGRKLTSNRTGTKKTRNRVTTKKRKNKNWVAIFVRGRIDFLLDLSSISSLINFI